MSAARPTVRGARPILRDAARPLPRRRPGPAARRARRRGLVRLAILVFVIALAVWFGVRVATASGSVEPVVHEVRAGETVWGIAQRTYSADTDLRRAVYEIERLNGLGAGCLQPGDDLVLPAEGAL